VAALLLASAAVGATLVWLVQPCRRGTASPEDPGQRLPAAGLVLAVSGDSLPPALRSLGTLPGYRHLITRSPARPPLYLQWPAGTPAPWDSLPESGLSAVGLYARGWVIVGRPAAMGVDGAGLSLDENSWRWVATDGPLLEGRRLPVEEAPPPDLGWVRVRFLPAEFGRSASEAWRRLAPALPRSALGDLRMSEAAIQERWRLTCGDSCLLDLLSPRAEENVPASGWAALPQSMEALVWFQIEPQRLARALSDPRGSPWPGLLRRLDEVERFLDIPLRAELAGALGSHGLLGLVRDPRAGGPGALAALDLRDPHRVRRLLDRIGGLGLLAGAVQVVEYRGTPVLTARIPAGSDEASISAAVDGGVLLVTSLRRDLEEAIDRRRRPRAGVVPALRTELEALRPGSWKAVGRSASLSALWETAFGVDPLPASSPPQPLSWAVLHSEGGDWTLEGGGGTPAWMADPAFPHAVLTLRAFRDPAERLPP
jgi:hypothetical protein